MQIYLGGLNLFSAVHTGQRAGCPVKFINRFAPCLLMEIVNVLGNDCLEESGLFHSCQCIMRIIRFCLPEKVEKYLFYQFPRFFGVLQKIINTQENRIILVPQAIFSTEGRDTTFNRDPRSCKSGNPFGIPYDLSGFSVHVVHGFLKYECQLPGTGCFFQADPLLRMPGLC